jgi:chromosome segregation ATPase
MNKNFNGWIVTGVTIGFLALFVLISGLLYVSDLKSQITKSDQKINQLETQVSEKSQQLTNKEHEINKKDGEVKDLENKNSGLSDDLDKKEKELNRRLGEVRKLQSSIKTVGRCLLGTVGVIEAFKQNDSDLARKSAFLMEATCQEAGKIVGEVEKFSANQQTAQY